jgi:hypothetical protein
MESVLRFLGGFSGMRNPAVVGEDIELLYEMRV